MKIRVLGTRGSIPVPGGKTLRYGGNTPCAKVQLNDGNLIFIDAGSGIREEGALLTRDSKNKEIYLFISHTHWDHIQGLPFFSPLFNPDFTIHIMISKKHDSDASQIIEGQINNFFFPINSDFLLSKISFTEIEENIPIKIGNATIIPKIVKHSYGTLAYKIIEDDKSFIYMTDNELDYDLDRGKIDINSIKDKNSDLIEFCENTDYLLHDCMYDFEDYKPGWGHSNHISVALFAHLTKVKNLVLFHYDPDYDDEKIDQLLGKTKQVLADLKSGVNCIAAYEGIEFL